MWKLCAYEPCGRAFETDNPRRIFCSARCRRSGQNAARRQARADARAFRESLRPMSDPWAVMTPDDGDGDIWSNALLDALPAGMEAERAVAFETAVTRRGRTESPALRSASEGPGEGGGHAGRARCAARKASATGETPEGASVRVGPDARRDKGRLRVSDASSSGQKEGGVMRPSVGRRVVRGAEDQPFPSA